MQSLSLVVNKVEYKIVFLYNKEFDQKTNTYIIREVDQLILFCIIYYWIHELNE